MGYTRSFNLLDRALSAIYIAFLAKRQHDQDDQDCVSSAFNQGRSVICLLKYIRAYCPPRLTLALALMYLYQSLAPALMYLYQSLAPALMYLYQSLAPALMYLYQSLAPALMYLYQSLAPALMYLYQSLAPALMYLYQS